MTATALTRRDTAVLTAVRKAMEPRGRVCPDSPEIYLRVRHYDPQTVREAIMRLVDRGLITATGDGYLRRAGP